MAGSNQSAQFPAHLFQMDGDPGSVRASAARWQAFGSAAEGAAGEITALDTSQFVGPEGDLFRDGLDEDMPPHLRVTGEAFGIVARALDAFAGKLGGLQDRMRPLANRAPGLWQALQNAHGRADRAAAADQRNAESTTPDDSYQSDSPAAGSALGEAQRAWDGVGSIRSAKETSGASSPTSCGSTRTCCRSSPAR